VKAAPKRRSLRLVLESIPIVQEAYGWLDFDFRHSPFLCTRTIVEKVVGGLGRQREAKEV
jgi:hypothetical protein